MITLHFLSDVAYDAESTQNRKLRHNRQFEDWINGLALRMLVESIGKPRDVN